MTVRQKNSNVRNSHRNVYNDLREKCGYLIWIIIWMMAMDLLLYSTEGRDGQAIYNGIRRLFAVWTPCGPLLLPGDVMLSMKG